MKYTPVGLYIAGSNVIRYCWMPAYGMSKLLFEYLLKGMCNYNSNITIKYLK